jgi:CRISPR/Cas system-associated exonuclease Cas4 (RecB family)
MNGCAIDLPCLFESEWNSIEAEFKDGEKEQMLERGVALMAMFAEQFSDIEPTAIEKLFRLPLISPSGVFLDKDIVGIIDCIADDTIIEYKTSAKSLRQKDVDESIQLTLYSWAYRMVFGKPEKSIKLVVLVRTKQTKIQVFETRRCESDYESVFDVVADVVRAVDLRVFYRNTANHSCESCVYRENCRG